MTSIVVQELAIYYTFYIDQISLFADIITREAPNFLLKHDPHWYLYIVFP